MDFEPLPPLCDEDYAPGFAAWSARSPLGVTGAREVAPRVHQLPLLAPGACARLLDEIDRRRASALARGLAQRPPNSMHEHGVALAELGFGPLLDALHARLAPLAQALLPEFAAGLDTHHSYLVDYSRATDEDLGFHVDDSEVTVNICLGDEFRGAELVMMGLRCDLHRQDPVRRDDEFEIVHAVGHAVLHAGRHRHRVDPVRGGRRRNLIMWSRSSSLRSVPRPLACAAWCGHRSN